jgi:4-hydroxy-tetrahydrodipicolinate synthase
MTIQDQLRGTGVAMITPFRGNKVDYEAMGRIIEFLIGGGVNYIVCLGTTGEAITLSDEELLDVLAFTIEKVAKRVPIIAGFFGDNDTNELVYELEHFNLTGCAAVMSSSPAYNRPTQEGLYRHYMALADASPLPLIIYNVPARTANNVEPETVLRLAHESDKFVMVKEASGVIAQSMRIIKQRPPHLLVVSGDDPITLPIMACGGDGVISVLGNAYPKSWSTMVKLCQDGKYDQAAALNSRLWDLHKWMYIEGNPAGIKAAMELRGLCTRQTRLPLVPLTHESFGRLQKEMIAVGLDS